MWENILTQVILYVLGFALTAIFSAITYLINKHIKNEQAKDAAASFSELVRVSVLEVYQTCVEELKDRDIFDHEAQKAALNAAQKLIRENMPARVERWLCANYGDVEGFITTNIEAQIGALKNSGRKGG